MLLQLYKFSRTRPQVELVVYEPVEVMSPPYHGGNHSDIYHMDDFRLISYVPFFCQIQKFYASVRRELYITRCV